MLLGDCMIIILECIIQSHLLYHGKLYITTQLTQHTLHYIKEFIHTNTQIWQWVQPITSVLLMCESDGKYLTTRARCKNCVEQQKMTESANFDTENHT